MSVDTKGIIQDVNEQQFLNALSFIVENISSSLKNNKFFSERSGFIGFKYNDREMSMFAIYEKMKYKFDYGGEERVSYAIEEYPFIRKDAQSLWWMSLGCCEESIEIVSFLTTLFNGWVDENDCDDKPWHRIKTTSSLKKKFVKKIFERNI